MFIIEKKPLDLSPDQLESADYMIAYELVGNKAEREHAFRQLTSLAITAAIEGDITISAADSLLQDAEGSSPMKVHWRDGTTFLQLVTHAASLAHIRREQLLEAGIEKMTLGAMAISDELILLDSYRGGPFHPDTVTYCTENGLGMFPNSRTEVLMLETNSIEHQLTTGGFTDWEEDIAKTLPVTHSVNQYEVPERLAGITSIPPRSHTSVGTLDENGAYVPFATILDPAHPARIESPPE